MAFSQRRFRALAAMIASVSIFFVGSLSYFCNIPYQYNSTSDLPLIFVYISMTHSIYLAISNIVLSGGMSQRDRQAAGLPIPKKVPDFFFIVSEGWARSRIGVRCISIFSAFIILANLLGYASSMVVDERMSTVMGWLTLTRLWAPMSYVATALVHIPIALSHLGAVVYVLFFWPQTAMPAKENAGPWQSGDGVERGELTEKKGDGRP